MAVQSTRAFPLLNLSTLYIVEKDNTEGPILVTNRNSDYDNWDITFTHGNSLGQITDDSVSQDNTHAEATQPVNTAGVEVASDNSGHRGNHATTYLHNQVNGAVTDSNQTLQAWTEEGTKQDVNTFTESSQSDYQPFTAFHPTFVPKQKHVKPSSPNEHAKWRSKPTGKPGAINTGRNLPYISSEDTHLWNSSEYDAESDTELGTTMVYVVNTAHEATPVTYLSGSFNDLSLNIHFKVKDIILAVCGTVACMFTLCMLITFTRCCCRKNKDTDSETDDDGDAEHAGSRKSSVKHSKSKVSKSPSSETAGDSSVTHVIVESTGEEYLDVRASHRDKDKLKGKGQSNLLSVKDRIKAFERQGENPEVKLREGKPKRKKPSSKAFEEFESQGILIGFGNVPKRRHTEYLGDGFEEDEADEDYISNGESYRGVRIRYPSEPQLSRNDSLRREIGEGADEDDEFAAVQRNSDILKSFRRAPPPKNRTRARRSGRRRPTSRMDQDRGGRIEEELPRLPSDAKNRSVTCGDSVEHEDFEQSLHMPTDKSASSRSESLTSRQSDNSDPVKTSRGSQDSAVSWEDECTNPPTSQRLQPVGASQTKVDCDEHEYEYTDIPRPRSQSESSNPALRPQRPVSYHSSHALSNTSENNNISDGQPFTYHKPPVPRHDRGRDRHVLGESRSHTSLVRNHSSPATRRLDFSPAIRRWESEHCELRNVKMVAMDTEDFHDDDWHADGPSPEDSQPHVYESLNYPKTDRLGRKFRSDEKDVNKTYPKSEKLNRKMMTTSMTSPPNLLYRPYYQSDEPQFFPQPLANGHHPQPNISEMSNGSQLTSNGYQNTRVVVCFNIDTKPTSV